jgi:hypothetical protein
MMQKGGIDVSNLLYKHCTSLQGNEEWRYARMHKKKEKAGVINSFSRRMHEREKLGSENSQSHKLDNKLIAFYLLFSVWFSSH